MTVKEQRKLDHKNKRRALHIRNKVRYANEGAKGSQGYSSNTNGAKGAEGAKGLEASNPTINRGKYKFDWINHPFDTVNGKHYNSGYARAIINGGAFKGYESLEEYDERQRNNESPKPTEQETQQQPKPQDKGTPAYDPAPSRKWAEALRHAAELKKDGEFDELKKYLADFGRGYYQRCLKDYSNWGSGEAFKAVTGQSFDIEKEGEKAFYAFVSGAVKKMMLMSPEELEKHADELDKDYQTRFAASKKEARVPYSPKSSKRWSAILRLCATHAEDGDTKELRNILSSLGGSYYKRCLNNREEWGVGEAFKVITGKEFEYDGRNKEDFRDYINSALSKILKSSADDLNRYADKLDADYKMRTQGPVEEPMGGAADSDDYSQGAVADDWDDEEDVTAPVKGDNPVTESEEQEQAEPQEAVEPTLSEDAPVIEDETPAEEEPQEPTVEPETVEEEPPVEENKETSKPEPNDKWGEYYQFIDDTSKEALFQSGRSAGFGVDPRLAFDVEAIAKDKSLVETALELNIKGLHKYEVQDEVIADLKGLFWEHTGKSQYFSAKTYWKALIQAGLYQIVDGQIKMTGLGKLITSLRAGNPIATKARAIASLNFLTNNRQLFAAAVIASQSGNDGFAAYCKKQKITGNRYTALRNALSLYSLFSQAGILEQGLLWNNRGLVTTGSFGNIEISSNARQCAVYVAAKYLKELNKAGAVSDNPSITLNTPFCNDIFEQIIKISGADSSGLTTGSYERNEDGSAQFVSFISENNFRNFAQQLNKGQWANSGVHGVVDGDDASLQFDNISDLDERFAKTFIGIDDYGLESLRGFIDRARGYETGRSKQEQTEEQTEPTAEEPTEEQAQEDAPVIGEETVPEDEPIASEEVAPEDEPPAEEQEEVTEDSPEVADEPAEEQGATIEDSETEPVEEVDDNAPTIEDAETPDEVDENQKTREQEALSKLSEEERKEYELAKDDADFIESTLDKSLFPYRKAIGFGTDMEHIFDIDAIAADKNLTKGAVSVGTAGLTSSSWEIENDIRNYFERRALNPDYPPTLPEKTFQRIMQQAGYYDDNLNPTTLYQYALRIKDRHKEYWDEYNRVRSFATLNFLSNNRQFFAATMVAMNSHEGESFSKACKRLGFNDRQRKVLKDTLNLYTMCARAGLFDNTFVSVNPDKSVAHWGVSTRSSEDRFDDVCSIFLAAKVMQAEEENGVPEIDPSYGYGGEFYEKKLPGIVRLVGTRHLYDRRGMIGFDELQDLFRMFADYDWVERGFSAVWDKNLCWLAFKDLKNADSEFARKLVKLTDREAGSMRHYADNLLHGNPWETDDSRETSAETNDEYSTSSESIDNSQEDAPVIEDEIPEENQPNWAKDQTNWAKDQTNWAEEQQEPVVEPEPTEELEGETDDPEEISDDDSSEEQPQYLHDVQDSVYELARLMGASQMFNHEEGRDRIIDLVQGVYDKGQDSYYKKFYDLFLKDKGDASTIFGILDGDEGEGARDNLVKQVESSIADALKDNPDASLEELLGIDNSQVESEEDEVASEEQEEPLDAPSVDEPVVEPPVDETTPSSEETAPYAEVQKNIADLIERHKGNPSYTAYLNQLKDGLQQAIDADDEDSANDIVDEVSELLNEREEETPETESQDAPVIDNGLTKESDITSFVETERAELKNPQIAAMKDEAAQNLPTDAFEREFTAEEFDKQYGEDGMTPDGAMLPFRVYDKFDDVSSLMRFVMAYRDGFDDLSLFNEKFKDVLDFYRVANQIGIDTDAADKALVKAYEAARDIQEQWHKTIEDRAANGVNGVDEPEKEDPGVAVMEETSEAEPQDAPVVSGEPVAETVSENTNEEPTADAEQENADAPVEGVSEADEETPVEPEDDAEMDEEEDEGESEEDENIYDATKALVSALQEMRRGDNTPETDNLVIAILNAIKYKSSLYDTPGKVRNFFERLFEENGGVAKVVDALSKNIKSDPETANKLVSQVADYITHKLEKSGIVDEEDLYDIDRYTLNKLFKDDDAPVIDTPLFDHAGDEIDAPVIDEPKQNKPKPVVKPAEKPKAEEPKETLRQKQIREAKGVQYSEQNTFKPESFGEQLKLKDAARIAGQWSIGPDMQLNMLASSAEELRSLYGLMNLMGLYKGAPTAFYGKDAVERFGELFNGEDHDTPYKTSLLTRLQSTDDDVKEYAKAESVVNLMNRLPMARYLSIRLIDSDSPIGSKELTAELAQKFGLSKAAAKRNVDELASIWQIAEVNGLPLPFRVKGGKFAYRDMFNPEHPHDDYLQTSKVLIAEMKYWSQFKADGEVNTLLRYLEGPHSPLRKYTRWNKGNALEHGDLRRWFGGLHTKYRFIGTTFTHGNDEVEFKGREFDKANPFGSVDAASNEQQKQESDEQSVEPPVVTQDDAPVISEEPAQEPIAQEPVAKPTEQTNAQPDDAPVVEEPQEIKPIEQDKEETINPEDVSNPLKSGTWKKLYSRLKDSDINSWDNSSPSNPTDAAIAQQYRDDFRTFSQHDAKALYKKHFDSLALSLAQASHYPLRDIAKFISNDHGLNAKKKEWDAAFFVRWMYDKRRERLRFALKRKGVDFKSDPTYKAIDKEARAAKKHYSLVHGDFTKLATSKLSAVTKSNTPENPSLYSHEDGKMNPIWTDREIESALPQVATGWDRDRDEERNEEIRAEEARKPEYDIDRQLNETRLPKEVEDSLTDDQLTISSFPGMRRKLIDYVILKNGGLSLKARKEIASGRLSLNDYLKDCVEHGNLLSSDDADRLFLRFSDNVTTPRNPGLASAVATKTASDIYSSDSFLKGMKERGSESYEFFKNINDSIDEAIRGHLGDLDDSQEQVLRDNTRNVVARVIESYLRENVASFWCRDKKENVSSHKNAQAPILILRPQDALAAFKSELDKMAATDPDFLKNILKGKQEETQDYKALEAEIGINTDLRGSEKQVNWANGIRHRFASDMSRFIKTGEPGLYDKRKIGKTILKEFAEWYKDGLYDDDEYKKIEEIVSAIDTSPETRKKFVLETVARLSRDGMTTATWWIDNDKTGRNPKGFNISSNFINSLMRVVSDYARESLYSMDDKENHFIDRSIKENSLPPIKGGTSQQRSYAEGIRQRALGAYNGYIETGLYPRGFNQIWLNDGNVASDLRSSIKHLLMNKNGKDPDDAVVEPVMKAAWGIFKGTRRSKTKRQEYVAKTFDSYTNKGRSDASLWIDADTTDYLGEPSKGQVVNSFFESMLYRIAEDALKQIPLKQEKESLAKTPNETPITPEEVSNSTSPSTWQKIYDAVKDRPFEYLTGHSDDKLHQSITEEFREDIKRFTSEDETDRRTDWFNSVVSDCMKETEYCYRSPKGKSATLHDGIVALSKFPVMFEKKNAVVMSDFLKEAFARRRDERREEVKLTGGNIRADAVYKMLNKIVLAAQKKNEEAVEDFKRMATRALSWDLDDNSEVNRNQVPQQMLYMKPRRRQISYDRYMEECEDAAMAIGNSL